MLKIRLQRIGKRNNPSFRVVVTDSRRGPKSADFVERLGSYNPHTKVTTLNADRVKHWIDNGAQSSDTVHNLLISQGVIKGEKINVLPKKSPIIKEQPEEAAAPATTEAPAESETIEEPAEVAPEAEETPATEESKDEDALQEEPATEEETPAAEEEEKKEA